MSVVPLGGPPAIANKFFIKTAHGKYLSGGPQGALACSPNTQDWEKWTIAPVAGKNNVFSLRSHHGLLVCAEGETQVVANRKDVGDWEQFELVLSPDTNPFDGEFSGALRSLHTKKFLSAQPDGHIHANREKADAWERFSFVSERPVSKYFIRTAHGKYLSAGPQGAFACSPNTQDWEKFQITMTKPGHIALRSHHNLHVAVDNETGVVANRKDVGDWEQFELVLAPDATPFDNEIKGGLKSCHTKKFLSAQPDGHIHANRTEVQAWESFVFVRA